MIVSGTLNRSFYGISITVMLSSLLSIFFRERIYSSSEAISSFVPNDVINLLFVGIFLVLLSVKHGSILWFPDSIKVGLLLYYTYIYTIYSIGLGNNILLVVYFLIIIGSMYTALAWLLQIYLSPIREENNRTPKYIGYLLLLIGVLFGLRQIVVMVEKLVNEVEVDAVNLGQWFGDLVVFVPIHVIAGILILRKASMADFLAAITLFISSLSFLGLIPFMIVQSLLDQTPIIWFDIVFVSVFGLIVLVPYFFTYMKSWIKRDPQTIVP